MGAALDADLDVAVRAFRGTAEDRRIWAAIAWRVGVDEFHYALMDKLSEDAADGAPRKAAAIRSSDEVGGSSFYTRRIKVARVRLSRKHPELLEVFNLIVKNGKNRRESIAKLAANGRTEEAANALYWKHLKKISFFFKVPY